MFNLKPAAGAVAALAMLAVSGGDPNLARAADGAVLAASTTDTASTLAYWTAERLKSARPKHVTSARSFQLSSGVAEPTGPTLVVPGAPPSLVYDPSLAEQLFTPDEEGGLGNDIGLPPAAVGATGQRYPYSINRLYPTAGNTVSNVYAFYPYAVVGQLFFTEPSGNFVCSASVIRESVIATAGHCVSDGNGHFYKNWLFVPAEVAGAAPFGKWNWSHVWVTGQWFTGGGAIPNQQDDALIVLAPNANGQKIGQLTGYLGYEYNAAFPTHLTQLGYPCNLDNCSDPVQDNSQVFSGPSNNFEWGTAAFGGASGGPEIQDFGQQPSHAAGTPPTETLGGNILIASTSYDYTNTSVQVDGGSILGAPGQFGGSLRSFGDLLNAACATAGNC
jgi:V8-like Glu-specific endopeptidase